jgi:type VI secretion system protein ImpL
LKNEKSPYNEAVANAVNAYARAGSRNRGLLSGLSRRIDVSKRPWLLVGGERGSGKSTFFARSGAAYEFVYPESGVTSGGGVPRWFFAGNAVYIDAPGVIVSSPDKWRTLCGIVPKHKFLQRRAIDGLLLFVDIYELIAMDRERLNRLAADLRSQADAVAIATGYEAPVYFVFSKADRIDGFCEFFSDSEIAGCIPYLGVTIGDSDFGRPPCEVFGRHYRGLYDELADLCMMRVVSADNAKDYGRNRLLYRFLSQFLLAEIPITAFFTEFFRQRGRRGRDGARFCGFYFTSSKQAGDDFGFTGGAALSGRLISDAIPNAKVKIREAGAWALPCYIKKAVVYSLVALVWAAALLLFAGGGVRDAMHLRALQSDLASIFAGEPTVGNQFAALERLRASYGYLHGSVKAPGRLIFRTESARAKVRGAYIAASERIIVEPAARFLESSIARRIAGRSGELLGDEHRALYRDLEMYLLLAGGNQVKGVNADSIAYRLGLSLKKTFRVDEEILMANISAVAKLSAEGRYKAIADPKTVQSARERLAAAPRATAVYAGAVDKLLSQRRPLSISQYIGGSELLRYGRDIGDVYTRAGWEQAAYPELIKASKAPFKADWVMGPVTSAVNEEKLLNELVSLYTDDLCRRWLDFIRNVHVNINPGLPALSRDLDMLASRDSEVKRMLATVCSLATEPAGGLIAAQGAPVSVSSIKGQISKLRGSAASFTHSVKDPFAEAHKFFEPLRSFLTAGAFDDYQKSIGALADKIRLCGERGGYASVFASRGEDPLKDCRRKLDRAWAGMPAAVSAPLKRVFEPPLDIAASALAKAVAEEIEESWSAEVVNHYNSKLSGRYPLDKSGNDLAWSDFEEFFKPQGGVLWKYRDKHLAGLTERTSRGWEGAGRSASLPLSMDEGILRCYNGAERVADNFFKKDGKAKRYELVFYPFKSSSGDVQFFMGEKQLAFQGSLPETVTRTQGNPGEEAIVLRLTTADKAQEEMRFTGEWGLVRFFEAGKVDRMGNDRYRVGWRINVRNIYTANITTVVQSNTEALFEQGVMKEFAVPKKVFK